MVAPNLKIATDTFVDNTGVMHDVSSINKGHQIIMGTEPNGERIQAAAIEHNIHTYDIIVYISGTVIYARRADGGLVSSGTATSATDNTTVIQAALNGLTNGRTSQETVLLRGNFTINVMLTISSYTKLVIEGSLKLADGVSVVAIIRNKDYGTAINTHIEITGGGVVDGNKTNGAISNCIVFGGVTDSSIHNLRVKDAGGNVSPYNRNVYVLTTVETLRSERILLYDLWLSGASGSDLEIAGNTDGGEIHPRRIHVRNIFSDSPGHRNVVLANTRYCTLSGMYLINATTHGIDLSYNSQHNTLSNFIIEGAALNGITDNTHNSSHNTYSNFRISNCTNIGIGVTASHCNFSDFIITGCGQDGLRFDSGTFNCRAIDGTFLNNSQGAPNTYSGIDIRSASNNNKIIGCTCSDDQNTKTQRWGISIGSDCSNTMIVGCDVTNNLQANGISDSGINTQIVGLQSDTSDYRLLANPDHRNWGMWMPGGATTGTGSATSLIVQTGGASSPTVSAADGKFLRFTQTTADLPAGNRGQAGEYVIRALQCTFRCKFRLNQTTNVRLFVGLNNAGAAYMTGDDPLSVGNGFILCLRSTDTNFMIGRRAAAGTTVYDIDTGVPKDTATHTFQIRAPPGDTGFQWKLDNGPWSSTITTNVPASGNGLTPHMYAEPTIAESKTFDGWYWYVDQKSPP